MKHLFLLLILSTATLALAQPLPKGFGRKLKTERPFDNLSRRIGAEEMPVPGNKTPRPSLLSVQATTSGLQPLRLRVVRDEATGLPIYIENRSAKSRAVAGGVARTPPTPLTGQARVAVAATAYGFLNQVRSVLGLENPEASFSAREAETDALGQTHIRMTQTHRGIPVYGAELVAHVTENEVTLVNGRYRAVDQTIGVQAKLTMNQAADQALQDVQKKGVVRSFGSNVFKLERAKGDLCLYPVGEGHRLAYDLTIRPSMLQRWSYIIDAETGAVLDKTNTTCTFLAPTRATARDLNGVSRTFGTFQTATNKYYLVDASKPMFNTSSTIPDKVVGGLETLDSRNTFGDNQKFYYITSANNTDWSPAAVSAHYNAGVAHDYYRNTHARNSLNGKGGSIRSVVNVADEEDGSAMDNAYWSGEFMAYGNGKTLMKPLAGALDVAGHEMTHGVIENSANLVYKSQSGAINESMADVFGAMIDRDDWTLGEDVIKSNRFTQGALRSLSNPNQGGKNDLGYQPRTMAQYETMPEDEDNDNGGVHVNSGIPNYAYYLFATATTKDKAERVYYRALTNYLTRTSKFLDLRLAVIKAATDLYGANSAEVSAARSAFDQVSILESTQPTPTPSTQVPVAQGQDLMLIYSSDNKLYSTVVGSTKFDLKSSLGLLHRPSVTDDGRVAYYVTPDKRIRAVTLTGTPTESIVSNETRWDNVAISKDGTKLAALSSAAEPKMYVYSFDKKEWRTFTLYNPTTASGVKVGGVKYADSFEWDFAGETVIYDAYNELTNPEGDDVSYWDVGFIKVWDNTRKDFAKGDIEKLFSNLDEGESVGNPSYAKNSTNIIAFDYLYEPDDEYYVAAADVNAGVLKGVYKNNTLGFPSYARLDNRIVFTTETSSQAENVAGINVAGDKISPAGTAQTVVQNAKWPVWYTQATRTLPQKTAQTITFNTLADRFANEPEFTLTATSSSGLACGFQVRSGPAQLNGNKLKLTGVGTVTIRAFQDGDNLFTAATPIDRSFSVLAVLGLEPDWADALKLYPVPAQHQLTVEVPASVVIEQLSLANLSGATVRQQPVSGRSRTATLPVSELPKGVYVLTIQTDKGVVSRKVMRE
ncbi:MAG: T9SS C-terminal target domain-containing protein [Cytophagales bacterium]|nr:MAG: T9SS C-terminal target domain-containing protein [Cytophagales bacterium]